GLGACELPTQFHVDMHELRRNQSAVDHRTHRAWIVERSTLEPVLFTQINEVLENLGGKIILSPAGLSEPCEVVVPEKRLAPYFQSDHRQRPTTVEYDLGCFGVHVNVELGYGVNISTRDRSTHQDY